MPATTVGKRPAPPHTSAPKEASRPSPSASTTKPSSNETTPQPTNTRKRKKPRRDSTEEVKERGEGEEEGGTGEGGATTSTTGDDEREGGGEESSAAPSSSSPHSRFLLFVGNLPYRCQVEDVQRLFASSHATAVRMPTDKQSPPLTHTVTPLPFSHLLPIPPPSLSHAVPFSPCGVAVMAPW